MCGSPPYSGCCNSEIVFLPKAQFKTLEIVIPILIPVNEPGPGFALNWGRPGRLPERRTSNVEAGA